MRTKMRLVTFSVIFLIGVYLVYEGLQPYPIRDMNGDGVINWKDYDVNEDGKVDFRDLFDLAAAQGSRVGDENYNPRCDFNGDGFIDDFDQDAFNEFYGQGLNIFHFIAYRATTTKGLELIFGSLLMCVSVILFITRRKVE